jgi:two-component system LytT family response regulator
MKKRISINTKTGIYLVDPKDIVYCKSDNSKTTLFFGNTDPIVISKGITTVEKLLKGNNFIRSHQSYLVNPNHIIMLDKTAEFCLILSNQIKIPISTRKRKEILGIIKTGLINSDSF